MKKITRKLKTFWEHFTGDDLTRREFVGATLVIVALKMILVCMQMIQIFPENAPVDDELMFYAAQSIGRGEWLGPYSWATIAKSMGFSVWLWLLHTLHIPYLIGNQLLYAGACVFTANALEPVFRKRSTRLILIFVLWFSPFATAQFTLRVYRDSILPAVILLAFAGVIGFCLRTRSGWKDGLKYAFVGGLFTAFARLIRDDAIWIYPFVVCATLVYLAFVLFGKEIREKGKKLLAVPAVMAVSFAVPVLLFCAMNLKFYGVFLINETSDPDFTAAFSAMQRADLDLPHPGIAVCRQTRERLYEAVPKAKELGEYLEEGQYYHGYGWPEQNEFNSGGFLWAVKRVSYESGLAVSATESNKYFRELATAIETAFEEGTLQENKVASVASAFLVPYDSSFLTPTLGEIWNSSRCILFFEQTSSLAPLSYATPEQAAPWRDYTYTLPSYIAVANTADPYYYPPQRTAEWIFTLIRWCYRIAILPALSFCAWCFFRELKETLKNLKGLFGSGSAMNAILILGVSLSVLIRVILISYIEVTNFRIGTYLLYLSGAAVLVVLLAAVGAAFAFERFSRPSHKG